MRLRPGAKLRLEPPTTVNGPHAIPAAAGPAWWPHV